MSTSRLAIRIATASALSAMLVVLPGAVAHASSGVTQISGLLVLDQSGDDAVCTDHATPVPPSVVSGSLVGCWYTDTIDSQRSTPSGAFVATGTEQFIGCLGARCGRIFSTYTFTARFDGDTELHGRCHHPITGGDGDFAGVGGVIHMRDLPNGCAEYHGTLDL